MSKKIIIITGASRGIGLATARLLHPLAEQLVLVASRTDSFRSVQGEFGSETSFHGADLSSPEEIQSFREELSSMLDRVDVLVNNCGVYLEKQLIESSLPEIQRQIDVNLRAPILLTHKLLPLLNKGCSPIVINISSIAALSTPTGQSVYSASKAAVTAFSNSLRKELNPRGIRVVVVHPAGVNTWNDPEPNKLLRPEDVGSLIKFILEVDKNCQIDEVTLSALGA